MKSISFEDIWGTTLVAKAKSAGVRDGDLDQVRSSVKNMLVSSGWVTADGKTNFLSSVDANAALSAATSHLEKVAEPLVQASKVTRAQVIQASMMTDFHSAGTSVVAGLPGVATVGDRCTKCSGAMDVVSLVNDRVGLYCTRDRVVLPLPAGTEISK